MRPVQVRRMIAHSIHGRCVYCEDLVTPGTVCRGFIPYTDVPVEPRFERFNVTRHGEGPHETPPPPSRKRRTKKPKKIR